MEFVGWVFRKNNGKYLRTSRFLTYKDCKKKENATVFTADEANQRVWLGRSHKQNGRWLAIYK